MTVATSLKCPQVPVLTLDVRTNGTSSLLKYTGYCHHCVLPHSIIGLCLDASVFESSPMYSKKKSLVPQTCLE